MSKLSICKKLHCPVWLTCYCFPFYPASHLLESGALAKAHEIIEGLDGNGYMLQQFENPANPKVHREETGPEIWEDTDGTVDIFISGVGTGGTLTGVSQFIKGSDEFNLEPKNASLITIGVEPKEQMLLTAAKGGEKIGDQGPHKIQGMGAGLVPPILDLDLIDEVVPVHSDEAIETTKELWNMGIPVGISSGAIVNAAITVCGRAESKDKVAVCIIPSFVSTIRCHSCTNISIGIQNSVSLLIHTVQYTKLTSMNDIYRCFFFVIMG